MITSRRNLLHGLGAIAVGNALSEATSAFGLAKATAQATPEATSIYVLFQGPWIISPSASGGILATTVGDSHKCAMGIWNPSYVTDNTQPQLLSPYDPLSEAPYILPTSSITANLNSSTPSSIKFSDLLDVPFKKTETQYPTPNAPDHFVRIKPSTALTPKPGDRTVEIPMPDNAYVGGILQHATVTGDDLFASPSRLFVSIIFEYVKPTSLTLQPHNGTKFMINPAQHLIFRLQHMDMPGQAERTHIGDVFGQLLGHFSQAPKVQLNFDSGCVSLPIGGDTACSDTWLGDNADGFTNDELGIAPLGAKPAKTKALKQMSIMKNHRSMIPEHLQFFITTYPNCAGGIIVSGG